MSRKMWYLRTLFILYKTIFIRVAVLCIDEREYFVCYEQVKKKFFENIYKRVNLKQMFEFELIFSLFKPKISR